MSADVHVYINSVVVRFPALGQSLPQCISFHPSFAISFSAMNTLQSLQARFDPVTIDWTLRMKLGAVIFGIFVYENIPPAQGSSTDIVLLNDQWTNKDPNKPNYKKHNYSGTILPNMFLNSILYYLIYRKYSQWDEKDKQKPLTSFEKFGVGLVSVGFLLRNISKVYLGKYFTYLVSVKEQQKVVDSGPYGMVRHPGYTGFIMMTLGSSIFFRFAVYTAFQLFGIKWIMRRIENEENFLLNRMEPSNEQARIEFAALYQEYTQNVSYKLVPFVY